jgi:hypothetical protein
MAVIHELGLLSLSFAKIKNVGFYQYLKNLLHYFSRVSQIGCVMPLINPPSGSLVSYESHKFYQFMLLAGVVKQKWLSK